MASNRSKNNPFEISPEKELQDRLKSARKLTRNEFVKRVHEARQQRVKDK